MNVSEHILIIDDEKAIRKIVYSATHDGIMLNSNFFAQAYYFVYDAGIFSEASVAVGFLILSSITGWILYVRRKKLIRSYVLKVYHISGEYTEEKITFNEAVGRIQDVKQEIDGLALNKNWPDLTSLSFEGSILEFCLRLRTKTPVFGSYCPPETSIFWIIPLSRSSVATRVASPLMTCLA